jgi:hypothetical protein
VFAGSSAAGELGLAALTSGQLRELVGDELLRSLLDPDTLGVEPPAGWRIAERPELRAALVRHLRRGLAEAWSESIHERAMLDGPADGASVALALSMAAALAGRLVPQHERGIFERCVTLLGAPADPYNPSAGQLTSAAREAASAILIIDASLDEVSAEAMAAGAAPLLGAAVASALRVAAGEGDTKRFLDYVRLLRPGAEELVRFAQDCDAGSSVADSLVAGGPQEPTWLEQLRARAWNPLQLTAPFLLGPAIAVGLAFLFTGRHGVLLTAKVEATVAIGALAVLAAVHVLSVQLAAAGLPASVARAIGVSATMRAAYGLALTLLALSIISGLEPAPPWHAGAVGATVLIVLVLVVAAATVKALRDTGPAGAATGAAAHARAWAITSGRRVATFRAQAAAVREAEERHGCFASHESADDSTRRIRLTAEHRGILEINAHALETLASRSPWRAGELRLDLMRVAGGQVSAGSEYASLVPSRNATVDPSEHARVAAAFTVSTPKDLERLRVLCRELLSQMRALAEAGQQSDAHIVQERLVMLLGLHNRAAEQAVPELSAPPSPVQVEIVRGALRALASATEPDVRDLHVSLISQILAGARKEDLMISLLAAHAALGPDVSASQLQVLYRAGQRAIEIGDHDGLKLVQRTLHRLIDDEADTARLANETASRLVQYTAVADPQNSRQAWSRYREAAERVPQLDRILSFARIGACALRAGNLSLAVESSQALPANLDLEALRRQLHDRGQAEQENMLSRLFGRLLGRDAEGALDRYIDAALVFRAAAPA